MTLTKISLPTVTTCSGSSTWRSADSEMWTRPSMPSSTRTNAPNGTSLVTLPGTTWPIAWVRAKCCHGSSWVAFGDRSTLAVHVDVEDLDGDLVADLDDLGRVVDVLPGQLGDVDQAVNATEVDERTEVDDAADDTGADLPLLELLEERGADLGLGLLEPGTARQDHVVAVLVELDDLGLDLLADVRLEVADATHLDERRRRKPRRPMSRMRPPLTTSMTVPVTTPSSSLIFSIVPQARSYCARFLDRIRRPSLSSFWRTRASTSSPTATTSEGSTSCLMDSSREGMTPSVL